MLTGIEIVGVVLAVTPLCISILENHQAELRPFNALLRYRKSYRVNAEELSICLAQLELTLVNLFRDAGISNDGQELRALVEACEPGVWKSNGREAMLVAHFGKTAYEQGFILKLERVREEIIDISRILGIGELGKSGSDDELWQRVKNASLRQQASQNSASNSQTTRSLKNRARYILKANSLNTHLEKLDKNIEQLTGIVESAAKRTRMEWKTVSELDQEPTFSPPLSEIEFHAQRLHAALHDVWVSCQHDNHHVNLRLDQRLKSRDTSGCCQTCGIALFTLAFAPKADAHTWNTIEVCVLEQDLAAPGPNTSAKTVRFSAVPGSSSVTASIPTALPDQSVQDLCAWVSQVQSTQNIVFLNEHDTIVQRNYSSNSGNGSCNVPQKRRVSFKSLLNQSRDRRITNALLSTQQSITLGSTIITSVLQLSATQWLAESWCSDNLFFLKSDDAIDIDETYVSIAYTSARSAQVSSERLAQMDGYVFIRLGVMLLEIWAQTSIENLRSEVQASLGSISGPSPWQDAAVIREYIVRAGKSMQPCFLRAINYCMTAFATGVLDARDASTRSQITKEVLSLFERELQYWRNGSGLV